MRQLIFILSIFVFSSCKNYSLIGTYSQHSIFISGLTLYADSTFDAGTGGCLASVNLKGKWYYKDKFIFLTPTIPDNIIYDPISKSFVFKELYIASKENNGMAIKKYYADLSPHAYKVKKNKLYRQYEDSLHNIKYACPFYKTPKDTTAIRKLKRLQRRNEIECSGLSKTHMFLLRLRIIK